MSQSPLQVSTVSPLSGFGLVFAVNGAAAALASMQSGTAAPTLFSTASTALREGQLWLDRSVTPHVVRMYSSTGGFVLTFVQNPAPDATFLSANFGI